MSCLPLKEITNMFVTMAFLMGIVGPHHVEAAMFFTDRTAFEAAAPGLTTLDFESIASAGSQVGVPSTFFPGVTISNPVPTSSTIGVVSPASGIPVGGFPASIPSDFLCAPCSFDLRAQFDFTAPVTVVGFDIAIGAKNNFNSGGSGIVQFFNGATSLGVSTVNTNPMTSFNTFIGFDAMGSQITSLTVTLPSSGHFTNFDNFSFGEPAPVPVPSAMLLMGSGLFGLVGWRWWSTRIT